MQADSFARALQSQSAGSHGPVHRVDQTLPSPPTRHTLLAWWGACALTLSTERAPLRAPLLDIAIHRAQRFHGYRSGCARFVEEVLQVPSVLNLAVVPERVLSSLLHFCEVTRIFHRQQIDESIPPLVGALANCFRSTTRRTVECALRYRSQMATP